MIIRLNPDLLPSLLESIRQSKQSETVATQQLADDGDEYSGSVTEVQSALSQVNQQRVFYGNNLNQISLSESFLSHDKLNLSQQENSLAGADPATAASNFAQAQIANQATLNATARVLGLPTLLDFLT
jgi:flagellin-like hook-associated protein FlgL